MHRPAFWWALDGKPPLHLSRRYHGRVLFISCMCCREKNRKGKIDCINQRCSMQDDSSLNWTMLPLPWHISVAVRLLKTNTSCPYTNMQCECFEAATTRTNCICRRTIHLFIIHSFQHCHRYSNKSQTNCQYQSQRSSGQSIHPGLSQQYQDQGLDIFSGGQVAGWGHLHIPCIHK